jgi:hypothetical protein
LANPGTDSPAWINASAGAPAYSASELRQSHVLAFAFGGRTFGGRAGIRPGGTQLVVQYANPTITVKAGVALVDDASWSSTRASYWVMLPADETFTATAANGTNPRKDILVLRVYDHDEDASGLRLARSEYIVGTPAASPAEPAVPAGAIKLAVLDVPNTGGGGLASAVVTNTAKYTAATGGVIPIRDATDEATLTPYAGLATYRLDDSGGSALRVYDGSAWDYARGLIICTSGTHPAHREGRVIYETDTDVVLVSDGSVWRDPRNLLAAAQSADRGKKFHQVADTGNTDASGYRTVTHGAGFTPTLVICTWTGNALGGGPTGIVGTDTYTSTTFRYRTNNAAANSNVVTISLCIS